jgi:hypothetical protein
MGLFRLTPVPLLKFALSIILLLTLNHTQAMTVDLQNLHQLQGYHRILLFDGKALGEQALQNIVQQNNAINERHIVWFCWQDGDIRDNYAGALSPMVKQQIASLLTGNKVHLIGKDGGSKYLSDTLDLSQIFAIIDSMPMRQREMQKDEP